MSEFLNLGSPEYYSEEASDKPFKDEQMRVDKINPKPKTYHEGANDERTAILAKVRRTVKQCKGCESFEKWLLRRNERYKKNPGGL